MITKNVLNKFNDKNVLEKLIKNVLNKSDKNVFKKSDEKIYSKNICRKPLIEKIYDKKFITKGW